MQIVTEITTNQNSKPAEKDRNQTQTALGKNKDSNNNCKNRLEQHERLKASLLARYTNPLIKPTKARINRKRSTPRRIKQQTVEI